ncbi:MAG: hypothetical protein SVM80_03135 [Halobacteriota archaeon]|nr:hypothetical protein [Halobacteriota archaeon]
MSRAKLIRSISVIFLLFLFSSLLTLQVIASEEEVKSIYGKVVLNDEAITNQTILLLKHQMGDFVKVSETVTDENGTYRFDGFDAESLFYFIEFEYQGVKYNRYVDGTKEEYDFEVYQTTESDEDIVVNRHSILVAPLEEALEVVEILDYRNDGDEVFNNSMLRLNLPEGRHGLQLSIKNDSYQEFNSYILFDPRAPIPPGEEYRIQVGYHIDFDVEDTEATEVPFERMVAYDTGSLNFFVEVREGIQVDIGEGLGEKKIEQIDGIYFNKLGGSKIEAGSPLSIVIRSIQLQERESEDQNYILWSVSLVAVVGIFFAYPLLIDGIRGKRRIGRLEDKKEKEFSKIAKIEGKFKAGNISKNRYEKIRSKYKKRAIGLMKEIDELKEE